MLLGKTSIFLFPVQKRGYNTARREGAMSEQDMREANAATEELKQAKNITMLVYGLQAASFFFGITAIAAVIINYIKKDDVLNTWLASHFRWQIRTFWFGLLWGAIGGLTIIVGVGFAVLGVAAVWFIYRIVKGWLRLSEGKEMYPS
jgi:uncharacterized membrane protein